MSASYSASARKFLVSCILVWSIYAIEKSGFRIYSNLYYSFFELNFYISSAPFCCLIKLSFYLRVLNFKFNHGLSNLGDWESLLPLFGLDF